MGVRAATAVGPWIDAARRWASGLQVGSQQGALLFFPFINYYYFISLFILLSYVTLLAFNVANVSGVIDVYELCLLYWKPDEGAVSVIAETAEFM